MNIYDVAELQQYLNPQVNQQSTQLVDPTMLFPQRSPSLGIQSQRLVDPLTLIPQIPGGITASSAVPFGTPVDIAQGFTRNTPSDPGTNFQFLPSANEADETDVVEEKKRSGGLAELLRFLSNFIPGVSLLRRLSDSSGIQSLNKRIQESDFGRSKNLMDFLDMKKFGGYDEREAARRKTIDDAARITSSLKRTAADDVADRRRGQISSRKTSAPKKSSSNVYSEAKRSFFR
jgi:hypothetical protein